MAEPKTQVMKSSTAFSGANFPKDADGRTYHVGLKYGEVANRIITCGDPHRAQILSKNLDGYPEKVFQYQSKRGFLGITGKYKGVPVSIVAIGMGMPMMDFFVREVREVVDGDLAIIRFGTCGCIGAGTVGQVAVADSSMAVVRNYDYFVDGNGYPYTFTKVIPADAEICKTLTANLIGKLGQEKVVSGLNVSADSFYSSQARSDGNFLDANDNLIIGIKNAHPEALTFEMETYMLFHLASCSIKNASSASNVLAGPKVTLQATDLPPAYSLTDFKGADVGATAPDESVAILKKRAAGEKIKTSVRGASCQMIVADRNSNAFISPEVLNQLESTCGTILFDSLAGLKLDGVHPDAGSVWEKL